MPSSACSPSGGDLIFVSHGPYLPLTTDTLIASAVAAAISDYRRLRQLPPITISCSHEHAAFPGTLSISATTLAAIITDIADSLTEQGAAELTGGVRHALSGRVALGRRIYLVKECA